MGWKEPIPHLFADQILGDLPDARYIHVVRDGLDIALSSNTRQTLRFGSIFGVHVTEGRLGPSDMLRYWVRANRRLIDGICSRVPDRTHVSFDALCADPAPSIARLLDFVGHKVDEAGLDALARIPWRPRSAGSHRTVETPMFDADDLDEVSCLTSMSDVL